MRLSLALLMAVVAAPCFAANWQPVAAARGERVDIDKSRILRTAPGKTVAWTRLRFGREMTDGSDTYTVVEAMNRYDCEARSFATVKRVFLGGPRGDRPVREEDVAAPRDMVAAPGSVDERLLTEACRLRTMSEARRVAEAAGRVAAGSREARAGVMYADMRQAGEAPMARTVPVADNGKTEAKPAAPAERPRFFALPPIDKSKLEDPYQTPPAKADEARPAAKAGDKPVEKAVDKPAARPAEAPAPAARPAAPPPVAPALSRQELERQYATSGPRRLTVRKPAPAPAPAPAPRPIPWSYEGEGAPANWAKLRPDYGLCGTGRRQSPIDIRDGIRVDLEPIRFDYRPTPYRIVDSGHTVEILPGEGNTMSVMGRDFQLEAIRFHRPAEERVNGKTFDMGMHLVHKDDRGQVAVIAVLLEKGAEHPLIQTFWNNMPLETNQEVAPVEPIDLSLLLPENRNYYTYMGSLTTPPCTEGVLWMIFKQPLQASVDQVNIFTRIYRHNARPIQPSNGRLIKENR